MKQNKVEEFIENFKSPVLPKERKVVVDLFTQGCCFWFAYILSSQFNGEIYYHQSEGHFICKINGKYYDIRGEYEVTKDDIKELDVISWGKYQDIEPLDSARCIRWCKNLEK